MKKPDLLKKNSLDLSINSLEILKKRYLLKDNKKNTIETPKELFHRVARAVAQAEKRFKSKVSPKIAEEKFYEMMSSLEFLPNSPTLMNAGTSLGQLSACFVLPVEDSIEGMFKSLKDMAKIHQAGGGTGFNFSKLRPKGDIVYSTKGEASGPVSFMSIFDNATGIIVQGGRRRGANMGVLRCDHPDIMEFINAKAADNKYSNFNLSVGITDKFMKAVKKNKKIDLINPRTKRSVKQINARDIFKNIIESAWRTGDPGIIFLDEINRKNPTPKLGKIEATNPCGELPLLSYESCNLGSINLSKMLKGREVDWEKLKDRVHWGVRFLDNVIEVNVFPIPEIKSITRANRKIGLGVMGFADMLIKMGISYNSQMAIVTAEKVMKFIRDESIKSSMDLAKERGVFPNFNKSTYFKRNIRLRNATLNTIAPTGTISIIAGCSSGIEPLFAISFVRNVLSGVHLIETNPIFLQLMLEKGINLKKIISKVARYGSLKRIKAVPDDIKKIFVTAFDVNPEQHLLIQNAFQKFTDNSVSKTINLPKDSLPKIIKKIFLKSYELKLKGITIYRYGSKEKQVLDFIDVEKRNKNITAESDYSGGCAAGTCTF